MTLNLEPLQKALATLQEAIALHENEAADTALADALRDSVIQRFEYTYELAWKTMQRWLKLNISPEAGEVLYSRKELFRLAARNGLIENPERWFGYNEARNVSAHTYDEGNAETAFTAAVQIVEDVQYLLAQPGQRRD